MKRNRQKSQLLPALIEGVIGAGAGYFGAMATDRLVSHLTTKTKISDTSGQAARNAYAKERGITPALAAAGLAAVGGGSVIHAGYPVLGASFLAGAASYAAGDMRLSLRALTAANQAPAIPAPNSAINSVSSTVALAGESAIVEDDLGNRYHLLSGDKTASLIDERGNVQAVNTPEATTFAIDRTTGRVVLLGVDEAEAEEDSPEMLGNSVKADGSDAGENNGDDAKFDGEEFNGDDDEVFEL